MAKKLTKKDVQYKVAGFSFKFRHQAELLEEQWKRRVGTTFPGISIDALYGVASWAGLSRETAAEMNAAEIYDYAMDAIAGPERFHIVEWSRPMSKKEAAKLLACPVAKKAHWINQCVKDGSLRIRECTRQTYQFDLSLIPENIKDKFR